MNGPTTALVSGLGFPFFADGRFTFRVAGRRTVFVIITGAAGGQADIYARWADAHPDVVLAGLVEDYEPNRARARERARRYGGTPEARGCPVFASVQDAIDNVPFSLAIVASRPNKHLSEIIPLLQAGKVVRSEKPPAETLRDAVSIADWEQKTGGSVTWTFQLREQARPIKEWVAAGHAGPPAQLRSSWLRARQVEDEQRALLATTRLGQPASRPLLDLCHNSDVVVEVLPDGTTFDAGYGFRSIGSRYQPGDQPMLETLVATASVPWDGPGALAGRARTIVIIEAGWNLTLARKHRPDQAFIDVYGPDGNIAMDFFLQRELAHGEQVPDEFLPQWARYDHDEGRLRFGTLPGPHPGAVVDCIALGLNRMVGDLLDGRQPTPDAARGVDVMELVEVCEASLDRPFSGYRPSQRWGTRGRRHSPS